MRVTCPCCKKRFDVPHVSVLQEAARLAERRKGGDLRGVGRVDGNVLSPADVEARMVREEAIRRRRGW